MGPHTATLLLNFQTEASKYSEDPAIARRVFSLGKDTSGSDLVASVR
jgi:hypothetical protein